MNELQVKTIELEPAKIKFNHEEIEKDLEKNLQKYNGLTFTEDDASECKKTIAELRKGKKAVDEYRKQKKKELTSPVAEFENKCKSLNQKFDEVINPLVEQHNEFEEKRKSEKRETVEQAISEAIEEYDLLEKYATQMIVEDAFLAKSKTLKSIKEELEMQAQHLKMQQDKEESDKQAIQSTVQYANSEYGVNLSESAYIRLLEFESVSDIKTKIMDDSHKAVEEKLYKEQQEKERVERETKIKSAPIEPNIPETPELDVSESTMMADPFAPESEPPVYGVYKVTGTVEQLKILEDFMRHNDITWEVVTDE